MEKHEIKSIIDSLGLSVEFEFIPWSKSRNKGEKDPSLNYKAKMKVRGKVIGETDYMMGLGHCPSYKQKLGQRFTIAEADAIKRECETGINQKNGITKILPDPVDFWYCISSDADVLQYSSFEEWADEFGYNPDSRKDEAIYRTCLETALKLNAAIGADGLVKLREAFEDY